jgi:hypothetical protein
MSGKKRYLVEYEKFKHINISPGLYKRKERGILIEVLKVDKDSEEVTIKTVRSEYIQTKTLHWCRKYLEEA